MEWNEGFRGWLEDKDKSENTIRAYLSDLEQYAEWHKIRYGVDEFSPVKMTATDLRSYKQALKQLKKSPATINRKIASQRVFNKWAIDAGLIGFLVAAQIKFDKVGKPVIKRMSRQQTSKMLAEYERSIYAEQKDGRSARLKMAIQQNAIAILQAGSGLRVGEVVALDQDDISIGVRSGSLRVRYGKGGVSDMVRLNSSVRKALSEWVVVRGSQPGPLFLSQKGGRLSVRQIQRYFGSMMHKSGIEGQFSPHSWRHWFIHSLVKDPEVSIPEAQRLARHASIQMTMRYAEPGELELQAAIERVVI